MIKAAIEKILSLSEPHFHEYNGTEYSDRTMHRMDKEDRCDEPIKMSSLQSLVDYLANTGELKAMPYLVCIESPTRVKLISSLDSDRCREVIAVVEANIPKFHFDMYSQNESFIIGVQSKFIGGGEDNDKDVILKFAGNVKAGTVAEYGDSGVGQKATIKMGAASLSEAEVPSPCRLKPFRTFSEVEQPMSDFIFRVRDDKNLGVEFALFEADGGAWEHEAKQNIKDFLMAALDGKYLAAPISVIS